MVETHDPFRVSERLEEMPEAIWWGEWAGHRAVFALVAAIGYYFRKMNPYAVTGC
jgi:hypothetical protein